MWACIPQTKLVIMSMTLLVVPMMRVSCSHPLNSQPHLYSASYHHQPPDRDNRKLIFVNNKAYDLSEEEQTRVWDLYQKKGYVPDTQSLDDPADADPMIATVMSPVAASLHATYNVLSGRKETGMPSLSRVPEDRISSLIKAEQYPLKLSRFVADPGKVHLIEEVDGEELQELQEKRTTTEANERVATESSVEAVTVHYKPTQVNALSFIWQEMWNFGELFSREVFDTVAGRLMSLWRSIVKFVQGRVRRAIPDLSTEL